MCVPMTKKSAMRNLRLLRRWGYLCVICGRPFTNLACVTVEHVTPRSINGNRRKADNLAPSHWRCNMLRRVGSIIQAANKIDQIEHQRADADSFLGWLNKPVPRKNGSPQYCDMPLVDAEWFFL